MNTLIFGAVGQVSVWYYVAITLLLTQITIFAVTLYLHRSMTHRAVDFHPVVSHFFRFWLWLTTGMKTHEWVAVHRKHHATCETVDDPHSPQHKGLINILFGGAWFYNISAKELSTLIYVEGDRSTGLPKDWLEKNIYSKYNWLGIGILLFIQLYFFGLLGFLVWGIEMIWIPFMAAGVINGIGHYFGYRNADTPDESRNISPWGLFIGGEELHNNHHLYPTSAKFSQQWFEIDIGWGAILLLRLLGLAQVIRVSHFPVSSIKASWLQGADFLNVFMHHKWLIKKWFSKMPEDNSDKVSELTLRFKEFFVPKKRIKVSDVEQWCADALRSGDDTLINFVYQIRSLHEVKT